MDTPMYTSLIPETNMTENVFTLPVFTPQTTILSKHIYVQYFIYQNELYTRFVSACHSDEFLNMYKTQYKDIDFTLQCFPLCGHLYASLLVDLQCYIPLFIKNMTYIANGLWKQADNIELNINTIASQIKSFIDTRIEKYNDEIKVSNLYTQINDTDINLFPDELIDKSKPIFLDISTCEIYESTDDSHYILTANVIIYILQFAYNNYMDGLLHVPDTPDTSDTSDTPDTPDTSDTSDTYIDIFTLHDTYMTTKETRLHLRVEMIIELINKIISLTQFNGNISTNNALEKLSPLKRENEHKISSYMTKINPLFVRDRVAPSNYYNLYASIDFEHAVNNIIHPPPISSRKNNDINKIQVNLPTTYNSSILTDIYDNLVFSKDEIILNNTQTPTNMEVLKGILVNNIITKTSDIYHDSKVIASINLMSEFNVVTEIDNKYIDNIGLMNTLKNMYDLSTSIPDIKDLFMRILNITPPQVETSKRSHPCELCDSKVIRQKSLIQHFIHRHKELLKDNSQSEEVTGIQSSVLTSEVLKYLEAIRKKHSFIINKNNISTHIEECNIVKKRTCNGMCFQYHSNISEWTNEIIDDVYNSV